MAEQRLADFMPELEQLRESQRELYTYIGELSAECVEQVALLRRLAAARPGGVYFNKWETEIYRVLNESPVTEQVRSEIKSVGVIEFAGMLRSGFQDSTRSDAEKQSAWQFAQTAERFARQLRTGKPLPGMYFASEAHLANALRNVSGLYEICVEFIAEDIFAQRKNQNEVLPVATPEPECNAPMHQELHALLKQHNVSVSVQGWAICDEQHIAHTWHMHAGGNLFKKTTSESRWKKWHSKTDQFIYVRDGYWRFTGAKQQQFLDMLFGAAERCCAISDRHGSSPEARHD